MRQPYWHSQIGISLSDDSDTLAGFTIDGGNTHHIDARLNIQVDVDRLALAVNFVHLLTHDVIDRHMVQALAFHSEAA